METGFFKHSFKLEDRSLTSLSVYNTGIQRCDGGYRWGPGIRDHFLIHYVMSGKGVYVRDDKTFEVSTGDLFLASPNEMITYTADESNPWTYCWVGFNGLDASSIIKQTDFAEDSPVLHSDDAERASVLMLEIYNARGGKPFEMVRMTGKLYDFLSWLMASAKTESKQRKQAGREHVQRACEFIVGNYTNPITVQDIAQNVGVCRSLLNRAFQTYMKISPVQYLTQYRMNQACLLLKRTDMPVKAVAYSVGYEDPLYFSRRFREVIGCSPRAYTESTLKQEVTP